VAEFSRSVEIIPNSASCSCRLFISAEISLIWKKFPASEDAGYSSRHCPSEIAAIPTHTMSC
jgi:hypothetical protein